MRIKSNEGKNDVTQVCMWLLGQFLHQKRSEWNYFSVVNFDIEGIEREKTDTGCIDGPPAKNTIHTIIHMFIREQDDYMWPDTQEQEVFGKRKLVFLISFTPNMNLKKYNKSLNNFLSSQDWGKSIGNIFGIVCFFNL